MVISLGKRITTAILAIGMLLTAFGCSQENTASAEPEYADEEAITTIGNGLSKRFEYLASDKSEDSAASLRKAIRLELDTDEPLKDQKYEDSKLQELVISYINVLNESIEVTKNYVYHSTEYSENWNKVLNKRTEIIKTFVDDYGLKLSGENQETLDQLVGIGTTAVKNRMAKETLEKLVGEAKFEKVDKGYGFYNYSAVIENTSDITFSKVTLILGLYNTEGVKEGDAYASTSSWIPGEKVKFESGTTINADKVKAVVDYYDIDD